jgi:threonine/homoserine/homoserine lactone efflux protein
MGMFKDCGCGCDGKKQEKKFMISLMSAALFFIVANPQTFLTVRSLLGDGISSASGCPTQVGLLVHTLVFLLITWALMNC